MKTKLLILALTAVALFGQIVGGVTITATVVTAGTAVRLSNDAIQVKAFAVQLKSGSATICVGGSNVIASTGTGSCVTGTSQNIMYWPENGLVYDLSQYWVDASSSSTAVSINYNVQR